jgi:thioredoxin reductase (NADPH)
VNAIYEKRREQMFPKLTPVQVERLEELGTRSATRAGEVLVEPGERQQRMLVVLDGNLEVEHGGERVTLLGPGDFSGELSTLRGVAGFTRIRARDGGTVLAIDTERLRELVQTDAELSEIMMRAFILRRMGLLASEHAEVTLVGSRACPATLRLREFLTRSAYPHVSLELESDPEVRALLERFRVTPDEIPVLIGHCGRVFRHPSVRDIAEYLNMNPAVDLSAVHDVVVVGAGPAGLSAATYAASEGLCVLVVESLAFGGQAGSSSKIENYLGFPTGISGQALAGRAFV